MRILLVMLFGLFGWASAQQVVIEAPPERFVAPGEFVTLVFRVSSAKAQNAELKATSEQGWEILRQPGTLELSQTPTPVAVTVSIPEDAEAFSRDQISLSVETAQNSARAGVKLNVNEARSLSLNAPREVVLSPEGFSAELHNRGNVTEEVRLELSRTGTLISTQDLRLEPFGRQSVQLFPDTEGQYVLNLSSEDGSDVSSSVRVIRFGVPAPEPFRLAAALELGVNVGGNWETRATLEGPLSDFVLFNAQLSAPAWRDGFAELETDRWTLRLGRGFRTPYRLRFPADTGFAGAYHQHPWTLAAALGWVEGRRFSGYALGHYSDQTLYTSLGLGMRSGQLIAGGYLQTEYEATRIRSEALLKEAALSARLDAEGEELVAGEVAERKVQLGLNGVGTTNANFELRASYSLGTLRVYTDDRLPLGPEAAFDLSAGLDKVLMTQLPGQLGFGVQLGLQSSFAELRYYTPLAANWQLSQQLGLILDEQGFGLRTSSFLSQTGDQFWGFDVQAAYYFSGVWSGRLGARWQQTLEPLQVSAAGNWDLDEQALKLTGQLLYRDGPWSLKSSSALGYSYAPDSFWSFDLSLGASYAFGFDLPEDLTETAGGRRLGTLNGSVRAGEVGVPGVEIQVGRFRLVTDEAGQFQADLAPGTYTLRLDTATLPITYRLQSFAEAEVEIRLKEETRFSYRAIETAAISGQILQDSDGDGVADEPARGVSARLILSDAEGRRQVLNGGEDGSFSARGLVPGEITLSLTSLPLGSQVVGPDTLTLELISGRVNELRLLVQPPQSTTQGFGESRLRVRAVTPQSERLPPGLDPLIYVELRGEAERVRLVSDTGEVALEPTEGVWAGRIQLPLDAPPGVFPFEIIAEGAGQEASRRGQIIIDADAPALSLSSDAPIRAGETLTLLLEPYFSPADLALTHPFGGEASFTSTGAGRYTLELPIPANTEDATYTLELTATSRGGQTFSETLTVRVLATEED